MSQENVAPPNTRQPSTTVPRYGTAAPPADVNVNGKRPAPLEWAPRKKPEISDPLVHHGRHFGRTVFAFANIHALILSGLGARDGEIPPTAEDRRERRVFVKLLDMVPNLEDVLIISSADRVSSFATLIQKGANAARSDDTRSMKSAILDWIAPLNGEPIHPHIARNSKLERGFHHELTGSLLCPTNLDWKDEKVRNALRNKEIIAGGADWPIFLYKGETYDPEHPWRGLLRSGLLIRAFKHVFISPSSADDSSRATRAGNARLHGMTRVTPASIAYIATQVRFALSSSSVFCRTDREGESELFYHSILELLEDPEEIEETKALLSWWDRQVFPAASNGTRIAPANSALSHIRAKRKALQAANTNIEA